MLRGVRAYNLACLCLLVTFAIIAVNVVTAQEVSESRKDSTNVIAGVEETANFELEAVQRALAARQAKWTAIETSMTRRSPEERQSMLGGLQEIPGVTTQLSTPPAAPETLPTTFSWGDLGGTNWMTPVKDQGSCGSCWAFAAAGMYEARERIRSGDSDFDLDISEQNMVSCWHNCTDWYLDATIDNFANLGCPDEACYPYMSFSGATTLCSLRCEDWVQRSYHVGDHGLWYQPGVDAMKQEIYDHGPIAVWMMIYSDFYSYGTGVYTHMWGGEQGGHFVVVYGWDDASYCWLVKNSWGNDWGETGPDGERGWFRMRMGINESGCETWVYYLESTGCNDVDGDQVCDPVDNCLASSNPNQEDSDGDGVGDACDICPGYDDLLDSDFDGTADGCDNCPDLANADQLDLNHNGIGDVCEPCCGFWTAGFTGNIDCDSDGTMNLADITRLIDRVYISRDPLCCPENGNVDGDAEAKINLADITLLIDHVYITKSATEPCL